MRYKLVREWDLRGSKCLGAAFFFLFATLAASPTRADQQALLRGKYLTEIGGCVSCHTAPGGAPFAGSYALKLPMGTLYTPNITPDKDTGIGSWTDDDFVRAMREGIAKDGEHLYPAFPYTSFTLMSRNDILAIKAYLFSLKPVHNVPPASHLSFPFNIRPLMAVWNWFFLSDHRFKEDRSQSAAWNRGAYLVQAVAHCGECHTPRSSITQAMETGQILAGGAAEGWTAYNITSDRVAGIGGWSNDGLSRYLLTGSAPRRGWAAGPMELEVSDSTQYLTHSDVAAVITYLRSVPPVRGAAKTPRFAVSDLPRRASPGQMDQMRGATLYGVYCSNCHGASTLPNTDLYPSMAHESTVGTMTPDNLIMTILQGAHGRVGERDTSMPSFARKFNDGQIADLVNYLYAQYGDPSSSITKGEVEKLRRNAP